MFTDSKRIERRNRKIRASVKLLKTCKEKKLSQMIRESKTRKLGQRACWKESGTRIVRVERGGGEGVREKVRLKITSFRRMDTINIKLVYFFIAPIILF